MYSQIIHDLKSLCTAAGVAGQEEIVQVATNLLSPLVDEWSVDTMGNIVAMRRGDVNDLPTVLLEAHLDEVGFLVTHIDDGGFVHVANAGSPDPRILTAQEVVVYGDKPYFGVFCSIPPHLTKDEQALPDMADRGIDVGLSAQEARRRIPLGSRVGFAPAFDAVNDNTFTGKSMDDRAGIAAILHALRQLKDAKLPSHIAVAFCVQEELGCRGASPAVRRLKPDAAIVTDVSFSLTPDSLPHECGRMGQGAMIGISPILDHCITDTLFSLSDSLSIPSQTEVMAGRTGTDADMITVTDTGVPTALLSIPLRYMHTSVETLDIRDIAAVGDLMAAYICKGGVVENG